MISAGQLVQIMPTCKVAELHEQPINDAMVAFGIDQTLARQCAFLAQVAEETGELRYMREIASGSDYEGRLDLGNTRPGDGVLFPGRGDLMCTGRTNYTACSLALYGDYRLLITPELLEQPADAANSGAWYFRVKGLNDLADHGDFETISARINGRNRQTGMPNGWARRVAYWQRTKQVLGAT